ncbi:MAG: endonuclease MutS2 [Lachnospiraceae bacterium]|nr:endonuclease MutS2 [Lachnospiraceae bacterium]
MVSVNERALRTLEYGKIIERLQQFAGSEPGRRLCAELKPQTELGRIMELQRETSDALARVFKKGSLSFHGLPDISGTVKLLEVGSALLAGELLKISSVLTATLRVKQYGTGGQEETEDSLTERFSLLEPLVTLNNEIMRCILSEEEIADDASAGLKQVRRQMRLVNDKIREQLASIVNAQDNKLMFQDALVTMRNGRYCLPVKQEYQGKFPGMIHDRSSKGSTVFMEPMAIVKLNNELAELAEKEKAEIERILAELSSYAAEHVENLAYNMKTLTELDFIFARASLSKAMKACEPKFNERGYINIKKGRHPLIDPHKVVPIDIYLGGEFSLLVITGPNTGGKTVSLKTVGLFTLMGQAGLHIPAFDGSELAVFHDVFADIGDEQSIEQSLSTFSSHMTNTVSILSKADEHSLVLFDELGAGTDPTEGAALAMSILTYLHRKEIRTMATTHYSELKVFALSTEGVSNACCEFSVETLRPTYRLLIGIPGKSNAFAISKKLGLPEEIIDEAKSFIGAKDQSFEDVIADLEKKRIATERDAEETKKSLAEAEALRKKYAEKNERLDAAKERILREANEQAKDILQEAKDYADSTIKKFNKLGKSGAGREMELERTALREKLGEKENSLAVKRKKQKNQKMPAVEEIKVGSTVQVLSLNLTGTVVTLPNAKGELYVQIGALRTQVDLKDIIFAEPEQEPEKKTRTEAGKIKMSKSMSISPECNLIGMRVDEALPVLEKYLDDAYLAHLPQVTIIHGRGTGALRDAVHQYLKRLRYVKSYRIGSFGEGDHGVTIVEF